MKTIFENHIQGSLETYWIQILDELCSEEHEENFNLAWALQKVMMEDLNEVSDIEDYWCPPHLEDAPELIFTHGVHRIVIADPASCTAIKFQPFTQDCDDDCAAECRIYEVAVAEDWGDLFCPIEKLMDYEFFEDFVCSIYISPFMECDEDKATSEVFSTLSDDQDYGDNENLVITAVLKSGRILSEVNSFFDFLEEWGCNDLHSGNWGFDGECGMRLVDYAGYGSHSCKFERV